MMSTQSSSNQPRNVTTKTIGAMYRRAENISMLTAYDYSMTRLLDRAGVDIILVGDSAANVMAGYQTTVPMKLDHMLYHTECVVRAAKRALVLGDLPFMSYQLSPGQALESAGRMMKEAGAQGVKLEGGQAVCASVEKITSAGIPVMGHLGLTPQSIHKFGGFATRAKEKEEAETLLEDARALEQAGCFALVLEKIPASLAARVTEALNIPTIGIGAGGGCSGQVLVLHDMLGMNKDFNPKFVRRYADLESDITEAVKGYINDVKTGDFPDESEEYE